MSSCHYLTDQFLIAMPRLRDPNFEHAVIYICDHNEDGAMGLIINKLHDVKLQELLTQFDIQSTRPDISDKPVFIGGPVQYNHGFILHANGAQWESTQQISDQISLTYSRDILEDIAAGNGPSDALVTLGYSGWGQGQIESEIIDNAWLHTDADCDIIFNTDHQLCWTKAVEKIGIDINALSSDAGHA